ncbi:MAG: hypothetical protein H0V60_12470 [Actinobacteria bacterium]|nr:hypothetical protein [Actinomycetota bacterium]
MRIVGRVIAIVLALALLAGSLLVVLEILAAGVGQGPLVIPYDTWYLSALNNAWLDPVVRGILIVAIIVGLILLYLAIASRKPLTLPLRSAQGGVDAEVSRKSLEQSLERAAGGVDGISAARVRLVKSRAQVSASTNRRNAGELRDDVTAAVDRRLSSLSLASPPGADVNIKTRS